LALPPAGAAAAKSSPSAFVLAAYAMLIVSGVTMYHFIAAKEFSSILTMAAMLQTFAFGLLGMQFASSRHSRVFSALPSPRSLKLVATATARSPCWT